MLVCSDNLKLAHKFLGRNIDIQNEKTELPESTKSFHDTLFSHNLPCILRGYN
jgi:hypothetical protein